MMHTIIPYDQLFYEGWEESLPSLEDISYGGLTMQVSRLPDGRAQVVRLVSANPHDYTNPAFMPGSVIHFVPKF